MRRLRLFLVVLVVLAFAAAAGAQFDTATVVGVVRDASGGVVPDAKVTLSNTATGVSVTRTTNSDGLYEFVTVWPGDYMVTAEKSGFDVAQLDNVQVHVAARQRVDLQMAIGAISGQLRVTG